MAETGLDRITLRAGTVDDIPGFRALGEAVVPPTYEPIDPAYARRMLDEWWVPEVFEKSLARNAHVVAERDGQVVGLANLGRTSQSYRDFENVTADREVMWKLYVHPDHQGAGTGSRLLAAIEELVEGDVLWLEVVEGNQQAYDFYRARGFVEVERVTDRESPDDIWMRKQLRPAPGEGPR